MKLDFRNLNIYLINRLKVFEILRSKMPSCLVDLTDKILTICCVLVNLGSHILKDCWFHSGGCNEQDLNVKSVLESHNLNPNDLKNDDFNPYYPDNHDYHLQDLNNKDVDRYDHESEQCDFNRGINHYHQDLETHKYFVLMIIIMT